MNKELGMGLFAAVVALLALLTERLAGGTAGGYVGPLAAALVVFVLVALVPWRRWV